MARTRETSNRTNRVRRRIRHGREDRLHQLPEASEETQPKKVAAAQPRILPHQKTTKLLRRNYRPGRDDSGLSSWSASDLCCHFLYISELFCAPVLTSAFF